MLGNADHDPVERTSEVEWHVVVLANRRAGVFPDVESFVEGDAVADGALEPLAVDDLAINRQRRLAAGTDPAADDAIGFSTSTGTPAK